MGAPGLAVAVVLDDELVFARGYGSRRLGGSERVDAETLFAIGSTTKAMTAASLGMLVDEGKLAWDDKVSRHVPEFELYDPYVSREVTLRDLLTHRAGLGNADFLWYEQDVSAEEILERASLVKPAYSFRSSFIYQNIMYAVAGRVVEAVSGMSWDRFVARRIFEPLEMTGTVPTAATLDRQPNVSRPHFRIDGIIEGIDNASVDAVAPAGAVWSSARDMSRWMRMLLRGGTTDSGERILSEAVVDELFRPQAFVDAASFYPTAALTEPNWTTYGLGWFQHDYRGYKLDFHTGSIDGMVAIIGLVRDARFGVYVLANLDHAELRHALMYRAIDLFVLDDASRDWSEELAELYRGLRKDAAAAEVTIRESKIPGTNPTHGLNAYLGGYSDQLYGRVQIVEGATPGSLSLSYGPGLRGPLTHWHYDTFEVRWQARWRGEVLVTFHLASDGEPLTLELGAMLFRRED